MIPYQIIQTLGDIMVPYGTPHDPHAQFGPDLPPSEATMTFDDGVPTWPLDRS